MINRLPVRVREMRPEDKNFILNSWLKSYRNSPAVKRMEANSYFHEQARLVEHLIDTCNVLVACNSGDQQQIYGYLVSERIDGIFICHYVYVKKPFRGNGIGKILIKARDHDLGKTAAIYTHHTQVANELGYRFRVAYNPYVSFYERHKDETDYAAIED